MREWQGLVSDDVPAYRAHVDNASFPLLLHSWDNILRQEEDMSEIDIEILVPRFRRDVHRRPSRGPAGRCSVVYQDIDPAILLDHSLHERLKSVQVRDVAVVKFGRRDREVRMPGFQRGNVRDELVRRRLRDVEDEDLAPLPTEEFHGSCANTLCSTGDQHHIVTEAGVDGGSGRHDIFQLQAFD